MIEIYAIELCVFVFAGCIGYVAGYVCGNIK